MFWFAYDETYMGTGTSFTINPPKGAVNVPNVGIVINNALIIVFAAAALLVLVFLIMGAFQWIMSGGEKEAVGNARKRITHALIGLAILVMAFVILQVMSQVLGISFLQFDLPYLGKQ